jgi:hypothetical protein
MSVDAILQQIDNLSLAERAELFAKLREKYGTPNSESKGDARPDQTGVYSVDQLIDRARRSR